MGSRGSDQSSTGGTEASGSMTGLLLDHPWRLDETLDPVSDGFRVLEQFVNLVRDTRLDVVPFVSRGEYDEMWQRIEYGRFARTRAYASLVSFAEHLVRADPPTPLATPVPEPAQLTPCWKRGLREAMVIYGIGEPHRSSLQRSDSLRGPG